MKLKVGMEVVCVDALGVPPESQPLVEGEKYFILATKDISISDTVGVLPLTSWYKTETQVVLLTSFNSGGHWIASSRFIPNTFWSKLVYHLAHLLE